MKILITGGGGYIGSHTSLRLIEAGHEVIILDSFYTSRKENILKLNQYLIKKGLNEIKIIESDIRDLKILDEVFKNSKKSESIISGVIHFAGLKSIRDSFINPLEYWDINVKGSIGLLNIMNKYNCNNIVFSSSACIYGKSSNEPLKETSKINPNNPYGKTKVTIENFLNDLFTSNKEKWRIANLRYFNPIGAHSSGIIGESPKNNPNNLFPIINQVASGFKKHFYIFGNDWPTLDGTCVRDYIHIMDVAEGHLAAMDYLLKNESQIININLGTGKGTSILELINIFQKSNNIKVSYKYAPRRNGDVASLIADNKLALRLLKWSPKRSIEEMCVDGWMWQKATAFE